MYMNHKHEMYMFICEIYKVYNFNFHFFLNFYFPMYITIINTLLQINYLG
jgi:hypothetical protein